MPFPDARTASGSCRPRRWVVPVGRVALMASLLLLSCVRHMRIDMTPDENSSMLYMARRTWPGDVSQGMVGVGTVRPLTPNETFKSKEIRAEHAAMLHVLHGLMKGGLPREVSEPKFTGCMERIGESVYYRRMVLDSGFVEVQIFTPSIYVNELLDCLYLTIRGQQR